MRLQSHIKIHPHAPKDRPDRSPEEKNLFIFLVEEVISPRIDLNSLVDIIGRGDVPDIELRKRLLVTGIVEPLPDESAFQVNPQRLDRLITEYSGPLVQWPLRQLCF